MSGRVPGVGEVLRGTPKAGTGNEARNAYKYARNAWADAYLFSSFINAANADLIPMKSGAIAAVMAKVDQNLVPGAKAVEQSAQDAGDAFKRYANSVVSIHQRADRLTSAVGIALYGIQSAMTETEGICHAILAPFGYGWNAPPPPTMPEPKLSPDGAPQDAEEQRANVDLLRQAYETRWRNSVLGWQSDVDEIATARRSWADLIEERRDAEISLTSALRDTPLGQLITVGAGVSGGRKRAIAVGLTGELGGVPSVADALNTGHPLLAGLFPGRDGSGVWDSPPDSEDVVVWWAALSQPEQEELIRTVPYVIGNLPGLPAWARDRANKLSLEFYRANPQLLGPEQLKLVAEVQRILDLEARQGVVKPEIQIFAFSLSENVPMVAVAYGNVDTASHITWQVGGMGNDAQDGLLNSDISSRNLYDAQADELSRGPNSAPSVIAWLGYDTPELPPDLGVLSSKAAAAGASRLTSEIDGLYVVREAGDGESPVINVLAHSYGTTVASIALTRAQYAVDSFVMLGSAGIDTVLVPSLDYLNVKPFVAEQKAIFATNASADRIAPSGAGLAERAVPTNDDRALFGLGARSPVFGGAIVFPADGDESRGLKKTDGHSAIGRGASAKPWGISSSEGHGYSDRDTQAFAITVEVSVQRVSDETLALLSVSEQQSVSSFVDPRNGHTRYIRLLPEEGLLNERVK